MPYCVVIFGEGVEIQKIPLLSCGSLLGHDMVQCLSFLETLLLSQQYTHGGVSHK